MRGYKCEECGAYLDPGERCDCESGKETESRYETCGACRFARTLCAIPRKSLKRDANGYSVCENFRSAKA